MPRSSLRLRGMQYVRSDDLNKFRGGRDTGQGIASYLAQQDGIDLIGPFHSGSDTALNSSPLAVKV